MAVALVLVLVGGMAALATSTATTRQAVNFELTVQKLPLYVKALDFLHRHHHYALLAEEITRGRSSDRERALAVLEWTRRNIRPTLEGWPIVDDHVLNIVIRGHGSSDQIADVFTVLATYAGLPAFWETPRISSGVKVLHTFVKIEGQWVKVDVIGRGELTPVAGPEAVVAPSPLRAELQMPWPRLRYEALRAVGLVHVWEGTRESDGGL